MRKQIKKLERTARLLDPDSSSRELLLHHVINYANKYLERIDRDPANFRTDENDGDGLLDSPIAEEGITIEEALNLLEENVTTSGVNPTSGRHLGYVPGGGLFHAALGDYLAAITNRYAGLFSMNPGAVRVENMLLSWMANEIGYPETSVGNLTSGGSLATLTAIVTARDARKISQADVPKAVCYTTSQTHKCVKRALNIAGLTGRAMRDDKEQLVDEKDDYGRRISGLGGCVIRELKIDDNYRMDTNVLQDAINQDKESGFIPWLVVASAGTVYTGTVDPLLAIGKIASDHKLWFHIDGAYGGMFILCPEGQKALQGIHLSDSIVLDPHKSLFLPYGSGVVLVRNKDDLYETFHISNDEASYIKDTDSLADGLGKLSPYHLSPELTKHFRGLRLWLPLKLLGITPFRAALSEKILLARYFYERVKNIPGFDMEPYPDLSIVGFRYRPKGGNDNQFNEKLIDSIQEDGHIYITSAVIEGKFILRAAILGFRTHLKEIDKAIEILEEKARKLDKE